MIKRNTKLKRSVGIGVPAACAGALSLLAIAMLCPMGQAQDASAAEGTGCSNVPVIGEDGTVTNAIATGNAGCQVNGTTYVPSSATLQFKDAGNSANIELKNDGVGRGSINNTISVNVENSNGYKVLLSAASDKLTSGSNSIPSITGVATFNNMPANTWGIATTDGVNLENANYQPVKADGGQTEIVSAGRAGDANAATNSDSKTIQMSVATAVDANTKPGNYTNTLTVSLVSEPLEVAKFGGIKTMQALTESVCQAANINDTAYLEDTRDHNWYWVTKLADGNCWMSQNLAVNLKEKVALAGGQGTLDYYAKNPGATNPGVTNGVNNSGTTYSPDASTFAAGVVNNTASVTNLDQIVAAGLLVKEGGKYYDRYSSQFWNAATAYHSWNEGKYVIIKPAGGHNIWFGMTTAQGGIAAWAGSVEGSRTINKLTATTAGEGNEITAATMTAVTMTNEEIVNGIIAASNNAAVVDHNVAGCNINNLTTNTETVPEGCDVNQMKSPLTEYGILMDVSSAKWEASTDPNFTMSSNYIHNGVACNKTAGWAVDTQPCGGVYVYDAHYLVGNYYQWLASVAHNNSTGIEVNKETPTNICPQGWTLPTAGADYNGISGSFYYLLKYYNLTSVTLPSGTNATSNGAVSPLFFGRAGDENPTPGYLQSRNIGPRSLEWSSVASTSTNGYYLDFHATGVYPSYSHSRALGFPLRCLVNSPVGGGGSN